jgi:hypothetical protein
MNAPPGYPQLPNPYAPPTATSVDVSAGARAMTPVLKWVFLVAWIATLLGYVGYMYANVAFTFEHLSAMGSGAYAYGGRPPNALLDDPTTQSFFGVYMLAGITMMVIGVSWLGVAWATLPDAYRVTKSGKHMSPAAVVGFMFIPCFSYYWVFPTNLGLCDAHDYLLEHFSSPRRSPRGLALAACICTIIPCTTVLVAPILWLVFMFKMERVKRDLVALQSGAPPQ